MRILPAILFLLLGTTSQAQEKGEEIFDIKLSYRPASFQIMTDSKVVYKTTVIGSYRISYGDLAPGRYKIQISGRGQATQNIEVVKTSLQKLIIRFTVDGPCLYDHPTEYVPVCPENHRDSIVRIVYGLNPTRGDRFIKNRKDIQEKDGGCVITGCDPRFYCKQHDIEF